MRFLFLFFVIAHTETYAQKPKSELEDSRLEFFKKKNCDENCIYPYLNLNATCAPYFPRNCTRICSDLIIDQHIELSMDHLFDLLKNMKHLVGSLAVGVNDNFKDFKFLSNLETIDTDYQIQFKITDFLTEIKLPNLTTINGPSWEIALHKQLKRAHFPNLKNITTHDSRSIEKFDIFFLGQLPEFCVSSDTIYNFMKVQGLKTHHVYGNICPPNFDNSKICEKPAPGCIQIYGDVNVGPNFEMQNLNSVEIIFGTLTINGARLENSVLLENLKYIAVLKPKKPAIVFENNVFTSNVTLFSLEKIHREDIYEPIQMDLIVFNSNNFGILPNSTFCYGLGTFIDNYYWTCEKLNLVETEAENPNKGLILPNNLNSKNLVNFWILGFMILHFSFN